MHESIQLGKYIRALKETMDRPRGTYRGCEHLVTVLGDFSAGTGRRRRRGHEETPTSSIVCLAGNVGGLRVHEQPIEVEDHRPYLLHEHRTLPATRTEGLWSERGMSG